MRRLNSVTDLVGRHRAGKPVIGCFPLYPPLELFAAMDLFPVVLWNLKSAMVDLAEADKHVQPYACAIARELVQFVATESGSLLDGIYSYNACDSLRNMPEILAVANEQSGNTIPFLRMHVPQVNRDHTNPEPYLRHEIEQLVEATEKAFGVTFSRLDFRRTTDQYAHMRDLCQKAEEKVGAGVLSFSHFSDRVLSNGFMPVEAQIGALETLLDQSGPAAQSGGTGVLISGIMPPPGDLCRVIESSGLTVVGNDIAALKRTYDCSPDPSDDPAGYYVDFFTRRFPCSTLLYQTDERLEAFLDLVEQSGARGVIFSGEKFCEYEYFEFPYLEKRLKERGVATLFLEFGVDDQQHVDAYRTRVEAFAEMLQG